MSRAPYYVQIVGPAGRVTYVKEIERGFQVIETENHTDAEAYPTEEDAVAACEAAERILATQRLYLTVCSEDEFEGESR